MKSLSSPLEKDHDLSPSEFVSAAHVDPVERLRLGVQARTVARILGDVFTGGADKREKDELDLDQMFSGLFEHPSKRDRDERCAIGRVQECMREPTLEKLRSIVESSQIPGFEFLRKAVYRVLENGSLAQKKMAARALREINPTMNSVVRALEQLVDKPQEKVLESPSKGSVPHKVFICPNIGEDPHRPGCCS